MGTIVALWRIAGSDPRNKPINATKEAKFDEPRQQ